MSPSPRPARAVFCSIAPPDLLARVAHEGSAEQRQAALATIAASASMRTQRLLLGRVRRELGPEALGRVARVVLTPERRQTVHDNQNKGRSHLPGLRVRDDDDPPVEDVAVNDVHDATAATWSLFWDLFGRNSLDGEGMELVSSVHYGVDFDNAFWNGVQMVYGDGSGQVFQKGALTGAWDVIGHELTHGVTEFSANLEYSKQSGALNEHFSDVFGSLVKQRHLDQAPDEADWLIGADTLVPTLGIALRSMKEPGTAYDGDRQPGHMRDYVDLPDDNDPANDNGGVHINSGIPNRAFYLAATALGGRSWETAGAIWYRTLTERLSSDSGFADAAKHTVEIAASYGEHERSTVEDAWRQVGVLS